MSALAEWILTIVVVGFASAVGMVGVALYAEMKDRIEIKRERQKLCKSGASAQSALGKCKTRDGPKSKNQSARGSGPR